MGRSLQARRGRAVALVVVAVLAMALLPGVAAAETRSGGTVVVEAGETVDGLTAYGGNVIVRGTVDGDLEAVAGNVFVEGAVTGDVLAYAGNVRIAGDVGGRVEAFAGNVFVEAPATVAGNVEAAGGNVIVAGTVNGDARLGGGTVVLAESASIGGDVSYDVGDDGSFENRGASVGGTVGRRPDLDLGPPVAVPTVPSGVGLVYGVLVNLVLGAILLLVFPGFSGRVAERVAADPLRTGGAGLLTLVAVPLLLLVLIVTIVGIPLALAGAIAFGLLVWVALVYGRFAVGAWLVSLADVESPWIGLVVGVLAVALAKLVPFLGGVVEFLVLVLGLGALAWAAYAGYRRRRAAAEPAADAGTPV